MRMTSRHGWLTLALVFGVGCASPKPQKKPVAAAPELPAAHWPLPGTTTILEDPQAEARHLRNTRQLTLDGARNAEAYFSPDGKQLVFQSVRGENPFYQVFLMDIDGSNVRQLSTGRGKAGCPFFAPTRPRVLFSSTHEDPRAWPTTPGVVLARRMEQARRAGQPVDSWESDVAMDIYEVDLDGQNPVPLTRSPAYDGEASYSPDGKRIVFTSNRDGDLDLYVQDVGQSTPRRLTTAPGYDGGAFFSPDGKQVVFRSFRNHDATSDIYMINADGSGERRLTDLAGVSWSPVFHPSGHVILFSSNLRPNPNTPGRNFDLYLLNLHSALLERITYESGHDGLPSFSPDGKHLVWTSSRQGGTSHLFMAEWVD